MRQSILIIILCCTGFVIKAAKDTLVTQDLRHIWLSVDGSGQVRPYTRDLNAELIFFELPHAESREYLLLQSGKPVDVWLNDQLILFHFDSTLVLDVDSLWDSTAGRLKFKIFAKGGIDETLVATKVRIGNYLEADLTVSKRAYSIKDDLYVVLLTLILLLAGIFRRYFPFTYRHCIQNPLSSKVRSMSADRDYDSFGSVDNLYSIFFLGAVSAVFFLYLEFDVPMFLGTSILSGLANWFTIALLIAVAILIKYLWTRVIAALYQFRGISNIQVQDFIRFFTLVTLMGTILTLLDFSLINSSSGWFRDLTVYLMLFALLFFQFWFFRKFDKSYSHKKLMIFSYLCTTEFLPGFLAIYWLVKM